MIGRTSPEVGGSGHEGSAGVGKDGKEDISTEEPKGIKHGGG